MPSKRFIKSKLFRLLDFYTSDESNHNLNSSSDSDVDDSDSKSVKSGNYTEFTIQLFGINEMGETCALFVNDYKPYFYIKTCRPLTGEHLPSFKKVLLKKIPQYLHSGVYELKLIEAKTLYGFQANDTHPFIEISFHNYKTFQATRNLWYKNDPQTNERQLQSYIYQKYRFEIFESGIPPLLRYLHIHNINPSGWVSIPVEQCEIPEIKTTTCTFEYICNQNQIKAVPHKETRVPYKICSFDIEASSSHGDFPLPIKTYKRFATQWVDSLATMDGPITENDVKETVLAAFGYNTKKGIDLVFPKQKPSIKYIETKIHELLTTSLNVVKEKRTDETKSILTLDNMFHANLDVAQGDDDNDDDHDHDEFKVQTTTTTTTRTITKATTTKKFVATSEWIQMLMNEKLSREDKINEITETFMLLNFPLLKGDESTFIGSTFLRYGDSIPYKNHCLVVGACDLVEGVEIQVVDTERDMLIQWAELIQREDPDIIIGYNIFGFDYEFMFRRSQELGIEEEFLQLSRRIGHCCSKQNNYKKGKYDIDQTTITLATGEYNLRHIVTPGRIHIDLYMYFRREFNLSSYKLDDVSSTYISDEINLIVQDNLQETMKLYSKNLTGLKQHDYIHLEWEGITSDYYQEGKKIKVLNVNQDDIGTYLTVPYQQGVENRTGKILKWSMSKDDITPQDIFRLTHEGSQGRAIVAKYCIQDCNLVHHLIHKTDVLTGFIEMSGICSVPLTYLIFRGQGIKLTSYVSKICRLRNILMPDLQKPKEIDTDCMEYEHDGYEGAIVLPPKCGMYMDNPVACVDYSSLYPSILISQNCSPDTLVWCKEYDLSGNLIHESGMSKYDNLPGYEYVDVTFDTFTCVRKHIKAKVEKIKSGTKTCRWAQFPNDQKGIIPEILKTLLQARSETKNQAKREKDPFMANILDKRQLGYKVTANSLYGQCGSRTSTFYEKNVAATTTACGRNMITYAKRMVEEIYGDLVVDTQCHGPVLTRAEYVYGDSVASYTPIYLRLNGPNGIKQYDSLTIEELAERYGQSQWHIMSEKGKQTKECCELQNHHCIETWSEKGWTPLLRVIRHPLASHKKMIRVVTGLGWVDVTDDHSLLTPEGIEIRPQSSLMGTPLLHCPLPPEFKINSSNCCMSYPVYMSEQLFRRNDDLYCVLLGVDTNGIVQWKLCKNPPRQDWNCVRQIDEIEYEGYVYDLTTANHHFAAGVGTLVVHNTDSVFFTFNCVDPIQNTPIRGKKALEITIEIAQEAARLCSMWLKPPMALAYEKTLMPFVLLSKKRYVGTLYEEDANHGHLKYMGLALKRRDACPWMKETYYSILETLMNSCINSETNPVITAIEILTHHMQNLVQGKVAMDKLCITRSLSSGYKNPLQIAHNVLAMRMAERDPGSRPKPGDRIKFVYFTPETVSKNKKRLLQGDRIETPQYILENKLNIDYQHYLTNQLMKPLMQLLSLCIDQVWIHRRKDKPLREFRKEIEVLKKESGDDLEMFFKKREKYASQMVKQTIFDPFLDDLENKKNKIRRIDTMFGPR